MFIDAIKSFNDVTLQELQSTVIKEPLPDADKFIKESQLVLQYTPCDEYVELLKLSNGFEWNGLFIDGAYDFLLSNMDLRETRGDYNKKFIIFGSGSVESYVYNLNSRLYCIVNMVDFDTVFEPFKSFSDMFMAALKEIDEDYYSKMELIK